MIRLLWNAEAPAATESVTRFGGLPLIPIDMQFEWPTCATCAGPMQFLGQIGLEDPDATRLLLLFMCQNDPGLCDEWDANLGGNRAILVEIDGGGKLAAPPAKGVTTRESSYGASVEAVDAADYNAARQQWAERHPFPLSQVLGHLASHSGAQPSWLQDDETPNCDQCGNPMRFVTQLEEGPDRKTAMNFGGGGCAYVFRCSCHPPSAKFLWQN
jgi:hypothetical protein